ncbi:hypothetical protein BV22DRAFT_158757 [Leucogyrophana mollusca]|uniref:Uncharacterized protein n=1 Tax=Leucogyrophana mollusca TaxID=85980 RepID=A0ACB8BTF8_9AGAM|nr:hypothetical protein BV22DRAFT_158757 [Leucogyrophana mollusca]
MRCRMTADTLGPNPSGARPRSSSPSSHRDRDSAGRVTGREDFRNRNSIHTEKLLYGIEVYIPERVHNGAVIDMMSTLRQRQSLAHSRHGKIEVVSLYRRTDLAYLYANLCDSSPRRSCLPTLDKMRGEHQRPGKGFSNMNGYAQIQNPSCLPLQHPPRFNAYDLVKSASPGDNTGSKAAPNTPFTAVNAATLWWACSLESGELYSPDGRSEELLGDAVCRIMSRRNEALSLNAG